MSTDLAPDISTSKPENTITVLGTFGDDEKVEPLTNFVELQEPTSLRGETSSWWLGEIVGIVGSAIAIAAIAILISHYDGLPVPNWSFTYNGRVTLLKDKAAHISLNSILSILSTVARICLLIPITSGLAQLKWVWLAEEERVLADLIDYEDASKQGLLGSVKLAWRLKIRHFAVVGAFAVIAFQGFDFFVQNLITYPVLSLPDLSLSKPLPPNSAGLYSAWQTQNANNDNAQLPPDLQVARISNATNYNSFSVGYQPYYSVDAVMKANIWASLYSVDPYGDWATPSYYCSSGNCTWLDYNSLDVCTRCSDLTTELIKDCTPEQVDPLGTIGCDVSLPNGFSLGGAEKSRFNVMAMNTSLSPLIYTNYSSPIAIVQSIIAYDTNYVNTSSVLGASECAFVPCVLNYDNSSVWQSAELAKDGYNALLFQQYVRQIWDDYTINSGPTIDLNNTNYSIDEATYLALKYYIGALLNGFVTADANGTLSYQSDNRTQNVRADSEDAMQAIYQPINYCTDIYGNQILDWIMCSMSSLSIGMTTVISSNLWNLTTNSAIGITNINEPVVIVAWLWIIPVVAFWFVGVIMLIGTDWKTRRSGVRKWRGSPLALVFLNLGSKEMESVKEYGMTEDGLAKKAKALRVKLQFTDNQAELVQC